MICRPCGGVSGAGRGARGGVEKSTIRTLAGSGTATAGGRLRGVGLLHLRLAGLAQGAAAARGFSGVLGMAEHRFEDAVGVDLVAREGLEQPAVAEHQHAGGTSR